MSQTTTRYHDFSAGHRVYGHEGACAHAHGHNYRVTFTCRADKLDKVGRVIDFKVMKERLCQWLEDNWDHRFLLWGEDPWVSEFNRFDPVGLVIVGFNPTAELLADYLLRAVGPTQLAGTGVELISVIVEETRKCSAEARL